jgi:double-stranded uracil-DNA glycosylase
VSLDQPDEAPGVGSTGARRSSHRGTVGAPRTGRDERLPAVLADRHDELAVGERLDVVVPDLDAAWTRSALVDLLAGAGFTSAQVTRAGTGWRVRGRRARTLADVVGPGMRLLVCGLNPSVHSADRGVGYAGPGNRFWPAVMGAGLTSAPLDARRLLGEGRVGMTDLVKRATPSADGLRADEYRDGVARVGRLVAWLRPGAVCFVGLAGWRTAVDRRAVAGEQPVRLGGRPVYVMPSTSGRVARVGLGALVGHLLDAAALGGRPDDDGGVPVGDGGAR